MSRFLITIAAGCSIMLAAEQRKSPWIARKDLPEGRTAALIASIGDRLYVLASGEDDKPGAEVFEYDPTADAWTKKTGAPSRRCAFGGAALEGRIYIWGGAACGETLARHTINDTVEVYDPAADHWSLKRARMPAPRLFAKGAAASGKLYAVGGIQLDGGAVSNAVHEYDPRADRWRERAPLPVARKWHRAVGADGMVYAIGGSGGSDALDGRRIEAYDPATNQWTRKADLPSAVYDPVVAVTGGEIWVLGGDSSAAVQTYDLASGRWSSRPNAPEGGGYRVAAFAKGRLFVIGERSRAVYEYDPAGDPNYLPAVAARASGWQKKSAMLTARQGSVAVGIGEKVYVMGGRIRKGGKEVATREVDVYDAAADKWVSAGPAPDRVMGALALDGSIYAINRDGACYRYDSATGAWTTIARVPTARGGFATAALNGKVYVIGGMLDDPSRRWGWRDTGIVEVYDPKTNRWEQKASLLKPGHAFTAVAAAGRIHLLSGFRQEVYDPVADCWTTVAPPPIFAGYFAAFERKGKVLMLPGMFTAPWAMQEYDVAENTWRVLETPAHSPRRLYAAAMANGKIYTFGGVDTIDWNNWDKEVLGLTEEYALERAEVGR